MGPTDRLTDDFARAASSPSPGNGQSAGPARPLVEELPSSLSPLDVFDRFAQLPYRLFLDSALVHPRLGRYSFLTADPFAVVNARGPQVWSPAGGRLEPADPFTLLEGW